MNVVLKDCDADRAIDEEEERVEEGKFPENGSLVTIALALQVDNELLSGSLLLVDNVADGGGLGSELSEGIAGGADVMVN